METLEGTAESYNSVSYKWYDGDDQIANATASSYAPTDRLSVGEHNLRCIAEYNGFALTKKLKLTVTKKPITNEDISVTVDDAVFTPGAEGTGTEIGTNVTVEDGDLELTKDTDCKLEGTLKAVNTGSYTVKIVGMGNYYGELTKEWEIKPLTIKAESGDALSKEYDGNADVSESAASKAVTFKTADTDANTVKLRCGTDYDITASFDSAATGTGKTANVKIVLKKVSGAYNYTFVNDQKEVNLSITGSEIKKAKLTPPEAKALTVINDRAETYTEELSKYLPKLTSGCAYGNISYGTPSYEAEEGKIGTLKVKVTSGNYEDITLTWNVSAVNKIVPMGNPELSTKEITYGDSLSDISFTNSSMRGEGNTTVEGSFSWIDGSITPNAQDSYMAEWKFTPSAAYPIYAEATGSVAIKVNKTTFGSMPVTVTEFDELIYSAQPQEVIQKTDWDSEWASKTEVTENYEVQYQLCEKTAKGTYIQLSESGWNTSIPKATYAGFYRMHYRVVLKSGKSGNYNKIGVEDDWVEITIAPMKITTVNATVKPRCMIIQKKPK